MNWLAIIVAILQAVAEVSKYLGNRQLIETGKARAITDGLTRTLANVKRANEAASAVADPKSDYASRVRKRFEREGE